MGCELIYKAYKLGYSKSLGTCADEEEEKIKSICTLRQKDEPYLHYAWRLIEKTLSGANIGISEKNKSILDSVYKKEYQQLEDLLERQYQVLNSGPRSSHHIWTNLPTPDGKVIHFIKKHLLPNSCITEFNQMSNRFKTPEDPENEKSKALEHTFGHLLFNPAYKTVIGACREFEIHWNSPNDVCKELIKTPELVLKKYGVLREVHRVINRFELRNRINQSRSEPPIKQNKFKPEQVISFHCLNILEGGESSSYSSFKYAGYQLNAYSLRVPPKKDNLREPFITFHNLSKLLNKGFKYGGYHSNEIVITASSKIDPLGSDDFKSFTFYLTQLGLFHEADLFIGHNWIQEREDLLRVYPHYRHLNHFVQIFRNRYKDQRGRL